MQVNDDGELLPALSIMTSPMWPFVSFAQAGKCPSDTSMGTVRTGPGKGSLIRLIRSMSIHILSPDNRDVFWMQERSTRQITD